MGALCLGFLIQVAEVIEWGGRFNSSSICCGWSASEATITGDELHDDLVGLWY